MNPYKQDQDEYDQPGPILSTSEAEPEPVSAAPRSYLRRRNYSARTRQITEEETQAYGAVPQRSKKPLIIALVSLGVIAILAIILVPLLMNTIKTGPNDNIDDLKAVISKYRDNIDYFELIFRRISEKGTRLNPVDLSASNNEVKKTINSNLTKVKKFRKELDGYGNLGIGKDDLNYDVDIDEKLATLKSEMDKRIEVYSKYIELVSRIYDVYSNYGSEESLKALSDFDPDLEPTVEVLRAYYAEFSKYLQEEQKYNCLKSRSEICTTIAKTELELRKVVQEDGTYNQYMKNFISQINFEYRPLIQMDIISELTNVKAKSEE